MDPRCERALELIWTAGAVRAAGWVRAGEAPEASEAPAGDGTGALDGSPGSPEGAADTPELVEARRHLAACAPCRAFLRRDSVLAGRIRDLRLCGATPCPEKVRACIERELEENPSFLTRFQERRRRWPAWAEGAVAAAAAALLIAGGLALSERLQRDLPNEVFAEDFRRTALPEIARQYVPVEEVEAFYRTQFGGEGPPVMLDAPVTKVAVCNLEGRMGAMVEYDWSGDRLVFYQLPRSEEGGRTVGLRTGAEGNLNLARWGDAAYDYALIAALPQEELARLARSVGT